MPSLCRSEFLSYIRAFNARDYAHQHSFYAPNVTLDLSQPGMPPFQGTEDIARFYAQFHSTAQEILVPMVILVDGDKIFLEMEAYFKYLVDTDQGVRGRTVKKGDVIKVVVWALYDINAEGKMERIRCTSAAEELLGQVEVEGLIEESKGRAQQGDLR